MILSTNPRYAPLQPPDVLDLVTTSAHDDDAIRALFQRLGGAKAPGLRLRQVANTLVVRSEVRSEMSTTANIAAVTESKMEEDRGENGGYGGGEKRRKLHGRAFYESIGSPKLVLAPMVEQSEFVRPECDELPTYTLLCSALHTDC